MVLNVTASAATMSRMMRLAAELTPSGMTYQCFQCAPQFGRYFKPAAPLPGFLREVWQRPGQPPVLIDRP